MSATSGSTGNVNDDSETGHRFVDDVGAFMTVILPRPYIGGVGVTDRIRCIVVGHRQAVSDGGWSTEGAQRSMATMASGTWSAKRDKLLARAHALYCQVSRTGPAESHGIHSAISICVHRPLGIPADAG